VKTIAVAALFLSSIAHAGELKHIRAEHKVSGDAMEYIQRSLERSIEPLLADRPVVVEPTIVNMKFVSGGKRFLFGPFAGGSYVTLRVRVTDGERVSEETFYEHSNAFNGMVTVGITDNHMLKRVAQRASEFVKMSLNIPFDTVAVEPTDNTTLDRQQQNPDGNHPRDTTSDPDAQLH
jgi:hypothetical protein